MGRPLMSTHSICMYRYTCAIAPSKDRCVFWYCCCTGGDFQTAMGFETLGPCDTSVHSINEYISKRLIDTYYERGARFYWTGMKARKIGEGYKFYYHGSDCKRNGVGIVLDEGLKGYVTDVKRVRDSDSF